MKNIFKKISATLGILAILGMSTASAGVSNRDTQLVINGNFNETNITYSGGSGGWTTVSTGLGSSVIDDPDRVSNKILEIVPDSSSSYVYQSVSGLTPGKIYRVRGRAKTLSGGGVPRIYMDGAYVWIGESPGVTTDWQYFDFNATSSTFQYIRLYSSTSAGGKVYFDDISVTQYYGTIQNRDVNIATDGNMEKSGTTAYSPVNSATLTKEANTWSTTGSQVLRVANSSVTNKAFTLNPLPNLSAGARVKVSGQIKSSSSNLRPLIYKLTDGTETLWGGGYTSDVQNFSVVATMSTAGYLAFYCSESVLSSDYCEWDNISVTPYYGTVQNRDTALGTDLNFEKAGTSDFTAVYANLTKETNDKGDDGEQFLRVTYNTGGLGNAYAAQNMGLESGKIYRITGQFRTGNASYDCRIVAYGSGGVFIGRTSSTSWTPFSFTFSPNVPSIGLGSEPSSGVGSYCDYDNVSITQVY